MPWVRVTTLSRYEESVEFVGFETQVSVLRSLWFTRFRLGCLFFCVVESPLPACSYKELPTWLLARLSSTLVKIDEERPGQHLPEAHTVFLLVGIQSSGGQRVYARLPLSGLLQEELTAFLREAAFVRRWPKVLKKPGQLRLTFGKPHIEEFTNLSLFPFKDFFQWLVPWTIGESTSFVLGWGAVPVESWLLRQETRRRAGAEVLTKRCLNPLSNRLGLMWLAKLEKPTWCLDPPTGGFWWFWGI